MSGNYRSQFNQRFVQKLINEGRLKDSGPVIPATEWFSYALTLPLPPSVNHYTQAGKNGARFKTKKASEYQKEVAKIVKAEGYLLAEGKIKAELLVYAKPDAIDLDNCPKCIADALNGVCYRDDSQIWHWSIKRIEHDGKPFCELFLSRFGSYPDDKPSKS